MSSTPTKRLNDDGNRSGNHGHSFTTKYQHEDFTSFPGVSAQMMSSGSGEFHVPYEAGQDSRMPKYPRIESHSTYRVLPECLMRYESRLDFQDPKDSNREPKFDNREYKVESRELYIGTKVADVKFESRGSDKKDTEDSHFEHGGDLRTDKEAYGGVSTHSGRKDSNEQLRGKRYSDAAGGSMDLWHTSRPNHHVAAEVGKDATHFEEKDYAEAREAVGENKVDVRSEDKLKDKDRKRKEGKHREWGERDKDRNDRRNDSENKDLIKDDRETDRWEKERKDLSKEKEKVKDRDKDYIKNEVGAGIEKGRTGGMENSTVEIKNFKDSDDWRVADRDLRDRKKDRDMDAEGERFDKCNRQQDKGSDEGCGDAEGTSEKEREGFSHGLQERRRMLRPRGTPQCTNGDLAFRPHNHDNNGSQGKLLRSYKRS